MNQQKVWHELENKEFLNLKLSKNVNKKKYCSKINGNNFRKGPDHLAHSLGKVIWSFWPNNLIRFDPLLRELHNQTDGIVYSTLLAIHKIVQKEIAELRAIYTKASTALAELSCEW